MVALVGNLLQFVDMTTKVISKSTQLYRSTNGKLVENLDMEKVAHDLKVLTKKLHQSSNPEDPILNELCLSCIAVSEQFSEALAELQIKGKQSRSKTLRKALKTIWGADRIQSLNSRLQGFREQLILHLSVDIR